MSLYGGDTSYWPPYHQPFLSISASDVLLKLSITVHELNHMFCPVVTHHLLPVQSEAEALAFLFVNLSQDKLPPETSDLSFQSFMVCNLSLLLSFMVHTKHRNHRKNGLFKSPSHLSSLDFVLPPPDGHPGSLPLEQDLSLRIL